MNREASANRSAARKQEKIEKRRKEYEEQKLVDGVYCILTFKSDESKWYTSPIGSPVLDTLNLPIASPAGSSPAVSEATIASNDSTATSSSDTQLAQRSSLPSSSNYHRVVFGSDGAVIGSKPPKTRLYRCVDVRDCAMNDSHLRITFSNRRFRVFDCGSQTGTFLKRSVFETSKANVCSLSKGRAFQVGQIFVEVVEVSDPRKCASLDQCFIQLKISHDNGKTVVLQIVASKVSCDINDLRLPEDDFHSEVEEENPIAYDNDDMEVESPETDDARTLMETPTDTDDNPSAPSSISLSSSEEDTERLIWLEKTMESSVRFCNGKFYLRVDHHAPARFFTRVKQIGTKVMETPALASGDVIRAGKAEFQVEIYDLSGSTADEQEKQCVRNAKDIGAFEYGNWGQRESMEDRHAIFNALDYGNAGAFFGVFDGHAGRLVADFVSCTFHETLLRILRESSAMSPSSSISLSHVFFDTFLETNTLVDALGDDAQYCGATAACGLLWKEEKSEERRLVFANVGDCKAFVYREKDIVELSTSHVGTNESERIRVEKFGGTIVDGRMKNLTVTRSFGDLSLAPFGMTCDPHVVEMPIEPTDKYIIAASDGLWDVVHPHEALELITPTCSRATDIAKALVHCAYKRGSTDNITAVVVCL